MVVTTDAEQDARPTKEKMQLRFAKTKRSMINKAEERIHRNLLSAFSYPNCQD